MPVYSSSRCPAPPTILLMQRIAELADDGVLDLRALPLRTTGVALAKTLRRCLDDRFHETDHGTGNLLADSSFVVDRTRSGIMAGWRQAVALAMTGEEIEALTALSRSRTEPAGRVSRAAMLLGYREKPSFFAVGRRLGVHHQTVQRCVERAMAYGALAALDDRPRPGKEPTITPEAKAWLVSLACDKAKEHGYPHELWTTRLFGPPCRASADRRRVTNVSARLAQAAQCAEASPVKRKSSRTRCAYYLERRDAEFEEPKMAEVLCVYREVQVLKKAAAKAEKSKKPVAIVSYDEKPGRSRPSPRRHRICRQCQAAMRASRGIMSTNAMAARSACWPGSICSQRQGPRARQGAPPQPRVHRIPQASRCRLSGQHRDQADPRTIIPHTFREETRAWLDTSGRQGRFDFTFTPKHGSWLNLIEGFFSKFARSVLRPHPRDFQTRTQGPHHSCHR